MANTARRFTVAFNVSGGHDGGFEVHKADCGDLQKKANQRRYSTAPWDVEAESAQAALDGELDSDFGGPEESHRDAGFKGRIMGCAKGSK